MNTLQNNPLSLKIKILVMLAVFLLPFLLYMPGINGPFVLDDFPNIVWNEKIHIEHLDLESIKSAATSVKSGPTGRPIAAISFAINYYFDNRLDAPVIFKLTNIILHSINSILVLLFMALILQRLSALSPKDNILLQEKNIFIGAAICAALWVASPIHLTSVLYVVQRMTSMSALFMLTSLITYFCARHYFAKSMYKHGVIALFFLMSFASLAILSKETGALIIPYILLLDLFLFSDRGPWRTWGKLGPATKDIIVAVTISAGLLLLLLALQTWLPLYTDRPFTLLERLLTESRVLFFYMGLILLPRLSEFGLHHDDIITSTSLLAPWTTVLAVVGIIILLCCALFYRKKYPFFALGVLWFFASHSLESTILPLDIAHEHRNYLAMIGGLLILYEMGLFLVKNNMVRLVQIAFALLLLSYSITTMIRSQTWSNLTVLFETNTQNHPQSPRAWMDLANLQETMGDSEKSLVSLHKAISLNPHEPAYYANLFYKHRNLNRDLPPGFEHDFYNAIEKLPNSPMLHRLLDNIDRCLDDECPDLRATQEAWLKKIVLHTDRPAYYYYLGHALALQGKDTEARHWLELARETLAND